MLINSLEQLTQIFPAVNYTKDKPIRSFQFDSRLIEEGDVFVALKAERDGHDFIQNALDKGAIAAIVEKADKNINIPQFQSLDSWEALNLIAQQSRKAFNGKTIAVTGSCGKTTAKQMLLHSLDNCYATEGNFNGLLGLPITLSHLTQKSDYCVLELGTDEIGNMAKLTNLAKPDLAMITSIGPAHLEMFKTINNIIDEKLSIANGLAENGTIIIPHEHLDRARELITDKNIMTVSLTSTMADIFLKNIENNTIYARFNAQEISFKLNDTASHKVFNALLIIASLTYLGLSLEQAISKIETFKAPAGRGEQTILKNNVILFDESYNANPLSMSKALESFKNLSKQTRVAILGDMLELGDDEIILHKQLISSLDDINIVLTVGPLMEHLFNELENKKIKSQHFANHQQLLDFLKTQKLANCDIIVKGSKGSKVSSAVELLKA